MFRLRSAAAAAAVAVGGSLAVAVPASAADLPDFYSYQESISSTDPIQPTPVTVHANWDGASLVTGISLKAPDGLSFSPDTDKKVLVNGHAGVMKCNFTGQVQLDCQGDVPIQPQDNGVRVTFEVVEKGGAEGIPRFTGGMDVHSRDDQAHAEWQIDSSKYHSPLYGVSAKQKLDIVDKPGGKVVRQVAADTFIPVTCNDNKWFKVADGSGYVAEHLVRYSPPIRHCS
ncbi:hypothetical protein G3I40_17465 [Streptomyces sp. SID14478]|uniref:hypothetical protein n=1 Tax=Streptomyces sp. SID14478 TaxID=2706073 RepID=UPI0013DCEE9F|nr:hypothetical protein [Streptomyces sp. SID14478]NEB76994.1 hypothetical protein [Streptomyces sp. SID14478]